LANKNNEDNGNGKIDTEAPLTIEVDEILFILGPSLKYMTNHETVKPEDNVDDLEESMEVVECESYDAVNHLETIQSRIKYKQVKQKRQEALARKKRAKEAIEDRKNRKYGEETDPDSMVKNFSMILKLMNVKVNKIHIRYEDDYFHDRDPYSFGLVVKSVQFNS
jgi:hypothetical protein